MRTAWRPALIVAVPVLVFVLAFLLAFAAGSQAEAGSSGFVVGLSRRVCASYIASSRTVVVQVKEDGYWINTDGPFDSAQMPALLRSIFDTRAERALLLTGDPEISFQRIASALDMIGTVYPARQVSSPQWVPTELRTSERVQGIRVSLRLPPPRTPLKCEEGSFETEVFGDQQVVLFVP